MIDKLDDAFRFHATALDLRAQRQEILASNIANADTPNYKARDVNFRTQLAAALATGRGLDGTGPRALAGTGPRGLEGSGPRGTAGTLMRTSARHFPGTTASGVPSQSLLYRVPAQASVDGNTVEMDAERAQFADNALHYEASITLLNMQIKNLLSAIQG